MTPERWEEVREVLGQVLELAPEKRSDFLDHACAGDQSLRSEVESLLSSDDKARSSFLQCSPIVDARLTRGSKLGDYEIVSLLGSGGMGEVYRARDLHLRRDVAIKVLPAFVSTNPERLRRFEQEALATAALNHPNILAVYQMGRYEGAPYLVSELLEGETLRERLKRGSIPLRKAIDYGVQIAHGLAAAHEKGIVHRDLKPENLFLTKDGRLKILDFGLAKLTQAKDSESLAPTLAEATEAGVVMGTVGYMSPEQVRGQAADQRSDIFALGAILYEMVTGKQTFRKPTSAETMTAILNEDPPSISQVAPNTPPGLQRVVHRCLEKDPEQRFHSAHDLAFALEALSDSAITSPSGGHARESAKSNRLRIAAAGAAVMILLGAAMLAYLWMRPEPVPRVSNYVQLTHDGQPKQLVGTDGSRLYMNVGISGDTGIAQMSISGGDPTRIPTPYPDQYLADISADGSKLLVIDAQAQGTFRGPLWSLPVLGGVPRRLGDTEGRDASWSPDGQRLAYSDNYELFVANADGTESRKVVTMKSPALISTPVWSPDGSHLRFDAVDSPESQSFLWEVAVDGTGLRRLLPGWTNPPDSECCGRWTADGKYFIFRSRRQIWALPRKGGFLHSEPKPIQLTFSPMSLHSPLPSKDGKKLFIVGRTFRGELMRYDLKSGQFSPFLGGISAEFVAFSRDGQWVAYVSFPEGTLWRSKADGSERLQLTDPPLNVVNPRWSPDGKKIVFFATPLDKPDRVYEVSSEGGSPQQLMADDSSPQTDPTWSPDGNKIVFAGGNNDPASTIRVLDLRTHQVSPVPGSQGFYSPRWSPSGRYIVAHTFDDAEILLFDFETQSWTELAKGYGWENWSKDGQYVYFIRGARKIAVLRIRISDHKTEQVVDLKSFKTTGKWANSLSLAPDDSPLLLRDAGTQDVYALDWEEP